MDVRAAESEPISTSSGFGVDALGAADGGAGRGEITSGAATAQTTRALAASVIKPVRTKSSDRFPQTGPIHPILSCKRFRHYHPSEGGLRA